MPRKHHIPGPEHTLGCPHCATWIDENKRLVAENLRLRAERDAAAACAEFAEDHLAEVETRLSVSEDVRAAKLRLLTGD